MKYAILTIDTPGCNLGNRLIEHAIKTTARLPAPTVSVSMFSIPNNDDIDKINTCDFLLLPGATILADGPKQGDALIALDKIKIPKICIGAGSWGPKFKLNVLAAKKMTAPIGVRDPKTLEECKKNGVCAELIGCPTLFLEKKSTVKTKCVAFGFSRHAVDWQLKLLSIISKPKIALLQEAKFEDPIAVKAGITNKVSYKSPDDVLTVLSSSNAVVTGRLHSAVPAVSQNNRIYFFGDVTDTRFSLLEYIGIKVHPIGAIPTEKLLFKSLSIGSDNVYYLRDRYFAFVKRLFGGRNDE